MFKSIKIVPVPKVLKLEDGYFILPEKVTISFKDFVKDLNMLRVIKAFGKYKPSFKVQNGLSCVNFIKTDILDSAYEIKVEKDRIDVFASTASGMFYAIQTLKQITFDNKVQCCYISDYPDLKIRGVMLDISRSKVPKVETLKQIFDMLAFLKFNHVELYVEGFSYEYKSFPNVLKDENYLTFDEYKLLEAYAFENFLDFVPNQNGFGHMGDWLQLDEYKDLAECIDGFTIWGAWRKTTTLNPLDDRSVEHVKKMYSDMIPYTKSKYFNMNFDEPYELGHGKSKEQTAASSVEEVYIDYLHKLSSVVKGYGKTPLIWGDVVIKHPEAIKKIDEDIILIDWGYTKTYPFEPHAKMLHEQGRKFMLAGGTSTWGVITCRYQDMYESIKNSCENAFKYGGLGTLTTDWGDIGHLQYLPNSYLGFIHASLFNWNQSITEEEHNDVFEYALEKFVGASIKESLLKLSRYTELEGEYRDYGSRLFYHILWAEHAQNNESPLDFFLTKMKSNYLSVDSQNKISDLLNEVYEKLFKLESLEARELLNSISLLKTLLEINKKLQASCTDFRSEISALEDFEAKHLALWNNRNKEAGFKFSINRIKWLKQILVQIEMKGDKNE